MFQQDIGVFGCILFHSEKRHTLSFVHTSYMFGLHTPTHTSRLSDSGAMTKGPSVRTLPLWKSPLACACYCMTQKILFLLAKCGQNKASKCLLSSALCRPVCICVPCFARSSRRPLLLLISADRLPRISIIDAGTASDEICARLPAVSIVCLIHSISARVFLHSR